MSEIKSQVVVLDVFFRDEEGKNPPCLWKWWDLIDEPVNPCATVIAFGPVTEYPQMESTPESDPTHVTRVVINRTFGGFYLSNLAIDRLREKTGLDPEAARDLADDFASGVGRDDPRLVAIVEELGEAAGGARAELAVVEVPAGVKWHIHDYDGREHVAEDHRTWQ